MDGPLSQKKLDMVYGNQRYRVILGNLVKARMNLEKSCGIMSQKGFLSTFRQWTTQTYKTTQEPVMADIARYITDLNNRNVKHFEEMSELSVEDVDTMLTQIEAYTSFICDRWVPWFYDCALKMERTEYDRDKKAYVQRTDYELSDYGKQNYTPQIEVAKDVINAYTKDAREDLEKFRKAALKSSKASPQNEEINQDDLKYEIQYLLYKSRIEGKINEMINGRRPVSQVRKTIGTGRKDNPKIIKSNEATQKKAHELIKDLIEDYKKSRGELKKRIKEKTKADKKEQKRLSKTDQKFFPAPKGGDEKRSFMDSIAAAAGIGLDEEQLKLKYAMDIGLDRDVLNLPGVKKFIASNGLFYNVKDTDSYKDAKESIDDNVEIIREDNRITIKGKRYYYDFFPIIVVVKDGKNIGVISKNPRGGGYCDIETRIFSNGIEMSRDIIEEANGRKMEENKYERSETQLAEVKHTGSIISGNYDISVGDGDISTLDNAVSVMRRKEIDASENEEEKNQRIAEMVRKSAYSKSLSKAYPGTIADKKNR